MTLHNYLVKMYMKFKIHEIKTIIRCYNDTSGNSQFHAVDEFILGEQCLSVCLFVWSDEVFFVDLLRITALTET